jgi:chaperonin GroES
VKRRLRRPEEVDSIAAEAALGLGRGNAGVADDREETALERVRGPAEGLRVEDPLQLTNARAAWLSVERRPKSLGADQIEAVGLVDGVFDVMHGQFGREIDEDRDGVGDRDAADHARRPELLPSVQTDAGATRAGPDRHRHVDHARDLPADSPELSGAPVTEPCIRSAGQRRRLGLTEPVDVRPSHGVHPRPELVQSAGLQPRPDRFRRHPEREQLLPRHHPVLASGESPGGPPPRLDTFRCHRTKSVQPANLSPAPRGGGEVEGAACETLGMASSRVPDPIESVRHQLRPLFDQIVIKELDQDRVRRSGLVVPPGTHEPPPEQGIVLAVGPGLDWWASAGVEMPIEVGDHVVFPASAGVWVEVDEERLLVCRVTQLLGVLESAVMNEQR